jgi:F-type H+-transporting ATPase subunit epsilon
MIRFQLVSASGTKFDDEAYEVIVPAIGGAIAVFEDHMPLVTAAEPGVISVRRKASDKDDDMQSFAVNGGIAQIDGKTLLFISDDVTAPDDVSEKEAEVALARAEELIKNAGTQSDLAEAQRLLGRSRAQLQVAKLRRRRHG